MAKRRIYIRLDCAYPPGASPFEIASFVMDRLSHGTGLPSDTLRDGLRIASCKVGTQVFVSTIEEKETV